MKYIYVKTLRPINYDDWFHFGRYTIDNNEIVASAWSDDLETWHTKGYSPSVSPYSLGFASIQEFLDDPFTIACESKAEFHKKYPEFFI